MVEAYFNLVAATMMLINLWWFVRNDKESQKIRELEGGGRGAGRKSGSSSTFGIWAGLGASARTPVVILRGYSADDVLLGIRMAREQGADVFVGRLD